MLFLGIYVGIEMMPQCMCYLTFLDIAIQSSTMRISMTSFLFKLDINLSFKYSHWYVSRAHWSFDLHFSYVIMLKSFYIFAHSYGTYMWHMCVFLSLCVHMYKCYIHWQFFTCFRDVYLCVCVWCMDPVLVFIHVCGCQKSRSRVIPQEL